MQNSVLGIDLAKNVFQLCLLRSKKVIFNKKVSRANLLDSIRQLDIGTNITLEACSTANP